MTDQPQDPCRVMAEQICDNIADYSDHQGMRENDVELIYNAIRDHTIVPEMVEFINDYYELILDCSEGQKRAKAILAKAGKK